MASQTSLEHAELCGQLRAQILARPFAFGKNFRANHLSLINGLGNRLDRRCCARGGFREAGVVPNEDEIVVAPATGLMFPPATTPASVMAGTLLPAVDAMPREADIALGTVA